jgi:hypothetical protein
LLENIPTFISITFVSTTFLTLAFFYLILKNSTSDTVKKNANGIIFGLVLWLVFQAILTIKGVYNSDTDSLPPKIFVMGVLPMILLIITLFSTHYGREFMGSLPLKYLTLLNIVRIPVELVLYWLFLEKTIPQLMTFEGRNFDILAGITAPFIFYFGFIKPSFSKNIILVWNLVCLALLINIVVNALLSAPSPMQKFAFEQPNIAILNFPFSWLATFVVPIVLFGHLVSIRQLVKKWQT